MNNHFMNSHSAPDPICTELESTLALLPLGELSAKEEATARTHAATCARCQRRLAEYGLVYSSLRHASPTSVISRPLFNVDDIMLSAALSDDEDEECLQRHIQCGDAHHNHAFHLPALATGYRAFWHGRARGSVAPDVVGQHTIPPARRSQRDDEDSKRWRHVDGVHAALVWEAARAYRYRPRWKYLVYRTWDDRTHHP